MHRFMVNIKPASIFKGILESWNSTRNGKNFAEMRVLGTGALRIYHAGINHAAPATALYRSSIGASVIAKGKAPKAIESPEFQRPFWIATGA
jgi:hypothetical protein